MFADLGNNMFGNKEDRDLIESIQGQDNSNSDRGSSSSSSGNKGKGSSMVDSFSREGDDDDLLESKDSSSLLCCRSCSPLLKLRSPVMKDYALKLKEKRKKFNQTFVMTGIK